MKKTLSIVALGLLLMGCSDKVSTTPNQVSNFNYSMFKEVMTPTLPARGAAVPVDVYDGESIIATNVSRSAPVVVGVNAQLTAKPAAAYDVTNEVHFYTPGKAKFGTMFFEDLFPLLGDYDMNDVVIGYNFDFVTVFDPSEVNNDFMVEKLVVTIWPRAIGASGGDNGEKIGLALVLNHPGVNVLSVNWSSAVDHTTLFQQLDKSGCEVAVRADQKVVPLTSDLRAHFATTTKGMYNVHENKDFVKSEEITVTIEFGKKLRVDDYTIFGANPAKAAFNIDLCAIFGERGKEVHLRGMAPTAGFDAQKYLCWGKNDASFSTKDNKIWALAVPETIKNAVETLDVPGVTNNYIMSAYPRFANWVQTEGAQDRDWYKYTNNIFCYTKNLNRN